MDSCEELPAVSCGDSSPNGKKPLLPKVFEPFAKIMKKPKKKSDKLKVIAMAS